MAGRKILCYTQIVFARLFMQRVASGRGSSTLSTAQSDKD